MKYEGNDAEAIYAKLEHTLYNERGNVFLCQIGQQQSESRSWITLAAGGDGFSSFGMKNVTDDPLTFELYTLEEALESARAFGEQLIGYIDFKHGILAAFTVQCFEGIEGTSSGSNIQNNKVVAFDFPFTDGISPSCLTGKDEDHAGSPPITPPGERFCKLTRIGRK